MLRIRYQCFGCGAQLKSSRKYRCEDCKLKKGRERQREYDRSVYAKERLGKLRIGDDVACSRCSQLFVWNSPTQLFCTPCAKAVARQKKRERYELASAAIGRARSGSEAICQYCHVAFRRRHGKQKFCSPCRVQYASAKIRSKQRGKNDPFFIIRRSIRSSIYGALKNGKSGKKWSDILGYTPTDLKSHLERQFIAGMTWANYGEWHIDHIVPIGSFSFSSVDDADFKAAFAITNLRPLWAKDNAKKHAKRLHLL